LPICPAETCAFCACTAEVTSAMVSWKLLSFIGSTQMRIAYCEPNSWKLPTPLMRAIGSWIFDAIMSARSFWSCDPSAE